MAKKIRIIGVFGLICTTLFIMLSSCSDQTNYEVDTSGFEVEIPINRLEDDLMHVNQPEQYANLNKLDSLFILQYKQQIMMGITGEGRVDPLESAQAYIQFTQHPDIQDLYKTVQEKYPDLSAEQEALNDALTHYRYYFRDRAIPRLITFISPFNAANATTDETLAIGLDMYLGSDFGPYYSPTLQNKFPQYKIDRCRRDYIVPNAVKAWLLKEFEIDNTDRRFLNQIIYEGKILHAMDRLLPQTPDSLKIGYHEGKIEWCKDNEVNIWNHIIQEDLLYSNDFQKFSGILTDGPFAKGNNVPPDAPPMIAIWTGWQIVRQYMAKNPETTLEQLMALNDPDAILKGSGYKPG